MIRVKIGNDSRTLEQWRASSASLMLNSFGADTFTMSVSALRWQSAAFPENTRVEVYNNDRRIFLGLLNDPTAQCHATSADEVSISAKGLWSILESTPYQNTWINEIVPGSPLTAIYDKTKAQIFGHKTNYVATGNGGVTQSDSMVKLYSANEFVTADVIPVYNSKVAKKLFNIEVSDGDFASSTVLPYEEKQFAVFSDIFSAIAKWHPELVSWYDYHLAVPVLRIKAPENVARSNVDYGSIMECSVSQKRASRPSQICLRVAKKAKTTISVGAGWVSAAYVNSTNYVYPEGADIYAGNTLQIAFDMSDTDTTQGAQVNYNGVLAQIVAMTMRDAVTGSVKLVDEDFSKRYVATRLNILNSPDKLENIDAIVQSEQIDLSTGERTLTLNNDNSPDVFDYVDRIKYMVENAKYGTKVAIE